MSTPNDNPSPDQPYGAPQTPPDASAPYSQPPAYNAAGSAAPRDEDKTIALLAHLGGILLSWIVPLVIFLVYPADKSRFVNEHAKEALNFQITLFIGYFVSGLLMFVLIGFLLLPALWVFSLIVSIKASMKASAGESYRYPMTIRLLK